MAELSDLSQIKLSLGKNSSDTNDGDDRIKSITDEIIYVLQLKDNENKDQIVNDLLESGRQSLVKYENDIIFEIYTAEMNGHEGKLINLLKHYFQQQWETQYGTSNEWFIVFLKQYQNGEKHDLYEHVLTRTAEYGNKYMKNFPILSIILQLLFEGIDDQCLREMPIFHDLWFTIITEGIESITNDDKKSITSNVDKPTTNFLDYIVEDVVNEQKNNKESILFQALRLYYDRPLSSLLEQSNVKVNNDVKNKALNEIANHGLLKGVEVIKPKTTVNLYKRLLENVTLYLKVQQEQYLSERHKTTDISSSADTKSKTALNSPDTTSKEDKGNQSK
ncbi:unnamed protein product [Rotaria sordida]|uniref:Uncharacterized protein n=1 Tax=Rotaria sordida TaxID=392033 RepID=A0A814YBS5_9BILA|nr:unnamed protein product [Rotaria sordida]CAF1509473.1 unnamed protein product [Rotaria sordida]